MLLKYWRNGLFDIGFYVHQLLLWNKNLILTYLIFIYIIYFSNSPFVPRLPLGLTFHYGVIVVGWISPS